MVRGLGRYLELRDMAKRQAEEKAAAESKAFKVSRATPPGGVTRPKPFNLSSARDPEHKEKLRQEAKQREMAECSFKPSTNESGHKEVVQQVLES